MLVGPPVGCGSHTSPWHLAHKLLSLSLGCSTALAFFYLNWIFHDLFTSVYLKCNLGNWEDYPGFEKERNNSVTKPIVDGIIEDISHNNIILKPHHSSLLDGNYLCRDLTKLGEKENFIKSPHIRNLIGKENTPLINKTSMNTF